MMANFLHGSLNAQDFSYQFPIELANCFDALQKEAPQFSEFIDDEMPELCASFDPYHTQDIDALNEASFREKIAEVYIQALKLSLKQVS